ncbi:MAG: NAD(+) synthase [Alphaproteobacteria bacterium]|nr:MAG: NAD(+) synthase [Alphaproteobacteria bacterium]
MNDVSPLQITLAQINPIVGDIDGNATKILSIYNDHKDRTDLIIFPEMCLSGYQAEDLTIHKQFNHQIKKIIETIEKKVNSECGILIGAPIEDKNSALLIYKGKTHHLTHKYELPNYGVFDEQRVFAPGDLPDITVFKGHKLGIGICEDFWFPTVAAHLKSQGAEILISLNGSPFDVHKSAKRKRIVRKRVTETTLPFIYVNQVGGQDGLTYDGGSFIMGSDGKVTAQLPFFETSCVNAQDNIIAPTPDTNAATYGALTLGLRDYVDKNGFKGVILGLSGGIDSAISAVIAVDALGADRVHCVMMPSPYTSQESLDDAQELAINLGCKYDIIPIDPAMNAYNQMLDTPDGITAENIQSRARGMSLMALSNRDGFMVLTTGNNLKWRLGTLRFMATRAVGSTP